MGSAAASMNNPRWRSGQVESGGHERLVPDFWPTTSEQDVKERAKMAAPAVGRGRRGLKALADTLGAVSARIVVVGPIARGPTFEHEIGELVRALVSAVERAEAEQGAP
jgi:hypothetical protein